MTFPSNALRACIAILAGVAVGCSGSGGNPEQRNPAALEVVSGNAQTAVVATELPEPVVARLVDATGAPVAGQIVSFRVTAGGGTVFVGAAITDGAGLARERWSLGTSAGAQALEARAVDANGVVVLTRFNATAAPGPAASLSAKQGSGQTGEQLATLAAPVIVHAADSFGNAVAGVRVSFSPGPDSGSATPASGMTDAAGDLAATWTLGVAVGAQYIEANAAPLPAASFSATATAASPRARLVLLSGGNQTAFVGTIPAGAIAVQLVDLAALGIPGQPVAIQVVSGGGVLDPASPMTTDSVGAVTVPWYLGTVPGTQELRVTATDPVTRQPVAPLPILAVARAGPAAAISGVLVGSKPNASVLVVDAYGNAMDLVDVAFVPSAGSGTAMPSTVQTAGGGRAATTWMPGPHVGEQTMEARVAGVPSFTFSRTLTYGQTCEGKYAVTRQWVSGNPDYCGGTATLDVTATGRVLCELSGPLIQDDGTFVDANIRACGSGSITNIGYSGTFVTDGAGNVTASGTMYQSHATPSMNCTGTWTAVRVP